MLFSRVRCKRCLVSRVRTLFDEVGATLFSGVGHMCFLVNY